MLDFAIHLLAGVVISVWLNLTFVEIAILLAAFRFRRWFGRAEWLNRIEDSWARFARRETLCILLAFIVPVGLRVCLLPWAPRPQPWVTDEFSHLLVADTLLHGRLANQPHPMWQHFETIHVFFQPTYASDYFPGQGAVLALGTLLGSPWIGVLLSAGLMCSTLLWMMYRLFPPRWALLGGVLAALHWGVVSYWVNSYFGGAVAAVGGALVVGSWAGLRRGRQWQFGVVFGIGAVILAYTRPLEGLAVCIPAALALAWPRLRSGRFLELARISAPAVLVVLIGVAGLARYDKAVTGDALRVPYRANQAAYGWPLTMPWYKPGPVEFRHREQRLYFEWERCVQYEKSWPLQALKFSTIHTGPWWSFFIGPALTIPLLWGGAWWRDRRIRVPVIALALSCGLGLVIAAYPHYLASATGCFLIVIVQAIRRLRARADGIAWSRIAVAACALMLPIRAFVDPARLPGSLPSHHVWSALGPGQGRERAAILDRLLRTPGSHVVFAQYHRNANGPEWVYNGADIDGSKVVWARDMGPERNEELLRYYPKRRPWLVRVDRDPKRLLPYDAGMAVLTPTGKISTEVCPASNGN